MNKFKTLLMSVVLVLSTLGAGSAISNEVSYKEVDVPVGVFCRDEEQLLANKPDNLVIKEKSMEVMVVENQDNGLISILTPAPDSIKPPAYKHRPGWCITKQLIPTNLTGEDT